MEAASDIRQHIFRDHMGRRVTAALTAEASGVLSGIQRARGIGEAAGLSFISSLDDGSDIGSGREIARVAGDPVQIARAEEWIVGALSKSSGIATAARRARLQAGPGCQLVSGGWKKMPLEIKELVRQAALHGGIMVRISEEPFVYLDKNYVRILCGIKEAVQTAALSGQTTAIQLRGETGPVGEEALQAVRAGAAIVMVDTGRREDLEAVIHALRGDGLRSGVRIAFGGEISLSDLETLARMDVDIVDIGYAIVDAPCLQSVLPRRLRCTPTVSWGLSVWMKKRGGRC